MKKVRKSAKLITGLALAGALAFGYSLRDNSSPVQTAQGVRFDLHSHIPEPRAQEAFETAIKRGMNLIAVTDYSGTALFDNLSSSNSYSGKPILGRTWDIQRKSPNLLRLFNSTGEIYLAKGQEVKSNKGHILAIGISKAIESGKEPAETINDIYSGGGFAILAHPTASTSGGVGELEIRRLNDKMHDKLFLEENAQYFNWDLPFGLFSYNSQSRELSRTLSVPLFHNSDIHGRYNQDHLGYGEKLHNFISGLKVNDNILEQILQTAKRNPRLIKSEGKYNTLSQTASWWGDSIRQNGWKKISNTVQEFKVGLKK